MFNISFVVVTVKARLPGFPRHLEEAAMDLGANEWTTFWKVTFPLILPGIIAAALLAFSLSIDDYVVTSFTAGQTQTFPLFIYGSQPRGIPVQVNVIGTIIFVVAVGFVAADHPLAAPRRRRQDYKASMAADLGGPTGGPAPWSTGTASPRRSPTTSVVPPVWSRITNLTSIAARGRG